MSGVGVEVGAADVAGVKGTAKRRRLFHKDFNRKYQTYSTLARAVYELQSTSTATIERALGVGALLSSRANGQRDKTFVDVYQKNYHVKKYY